MPEESLSTRQKRMHCRSTAFSTFAGCCWPFQVDDYLSRLDQVPLLHNAKEDQLCLQHLSKDLFTQGTSQPASVSDALIGVSHVLISSRQRVQARGK
jgi:hypothetical protein